MRTDPESVKKIFKLSVFFALLGSAHAKGTCRVMLKLTLGDNLTKFFDKCFCNLDLSLICVDVLRQLGLSYLV